MVDITNIFIVKIVGLYAISIACMVLGISMSYKGKWNQVLGIECMIIGIFLVMAGISLIIAMHINKISNYEGFAAYFTSIGLCVLILGLCFIGNQKKIDFEINRNKIVKKNSH
ncbi:hypothetical protein ACFIJ5_14855 [Haloimpatiens sp. FM7330]|uniref:hypothetical protein n=1 Tax=Haloimpatiens sp. FM7330 TaxID=3298610 RepID=UPI00363801DF